MKINYRRFVQVFILSIAGVFLSLLLTGSPRAGRALAGTPPPMDKSRVDSAVLEALQTNTSADFVIEIGKQPDLSAAYSITDWDERGRYVVDILKASAAKSQSRALAELNRRGLRSRAFFASNEIYVYGGDTPALQALLALPEVARVRAPVTVHLEPAGILLRPYGPAAPQAQIQGSIDWGITDTKADQFWSAFATTGQGIVVANIDTGVDVAHPALAGSYRCAGGTLTDPTCWSDPTGQCEGSVCDNHWHGTHTMGTMVASNDPTLANIVGMAPGAQWIACKGFTSDGQGTDVDLLACADWILAPGGDPSKRPQVVNNSWGDTGGNPWFVDAVNAWRVAGIFPVFSAGNSYSCNSLSSPGDYQETFGSAAHSSNRTIAIFSSKGPSLFGDSPYTKPNLSAPGNSIYSTYPTNLQPSYPWASKSGTSMASPHNAGTVALLWSCAPSLVGQIDATFQLLQSSADAAPAGSCGAPASGQGNYTYGYGYLDSLAAGSQVCYVRQIKGVVRDALTDQPLGNVEISLDNHITAPVITHTDENGNYSQFLPAGNYSLAASVDGYISKFFSNILITDDQLTTRDFSMIALDTCSELNYLRLGGLSQNFESLSLPMGWQVTDGQGNGHVWVFDDPGQRGNLTGATGGFAAADASYFNGPMDTSLVSPIMNFTSSILTTLTFNTDYFHGTGQGSTASVEISLDGGSTWSSVWQATDADITGSVPGIDLTDLIAGQADVQLRFHYANSNNSGWWQIDHIELTPAPTCEFKYKLYFPLVSNSSIY